MFNNLSEKFSKTLKKIAGRGRLTEDNIKNTLRDIRVSLLDADVALPVVTEFLAHVQERAIGQEVLRSLNPGQTLTKIVHEELVNIMGENFEGLNLKNTPPVVILMAGLQGSGKTTTTAKLARFLREQEKKKVLVASTDVYRPAAIEQLKKLAEELEIDFFPSESSQKPSDIAKQALQTAKTQFHDVVIIDTAGRLHVDNDMMDEIKSLHATVNPTETLFVVDSMTGQDAANSAKAFGDALPLTGVILTKTDGDARGGAALSVKHITGKAIKFMGTGEKTENLERFHPDRVASRILGMGDMLTLIEEVEQKVDKKKSEKLAKKLRKGKGFNLTDFRDQIAQMKDMGGMMGIMGKMPGMGNMVKAAQGQAGDDTMQRYVHMIDSMTPKERDFPDLIDGSRKRRIAKGCGREVQDINSLLKKFKQMQKMMKKFAKPGAMKQLMRGMQGFGQ